MFKDAKEQRAQFIADGFNIEIQTHRKPDTPLRKRWFSCPRAANQCFEKRAGKFHSVRLIHYDKNARPVVMRHINAKRNHNFLRSNWSKITGRFGWLINPEPKYSLEKPA